jgi:hypothetical protein
VSRGFDWGPTLTSVVEYLGPDDQPEVLFTAVTPEPESGGHLISGMLMPLAWAISRVMWRHETRVAGRVADVPLAPRMFVALTARRLVIWQATRGWRLGEVSGELPRERILQVTEAARGARSRRLVLQLSTGSSFSLRVTPAAADKITAFFSTQA